MAAGTTRLREALGDDWEELGVVAARAGLSRYAAKQGLETLEEWGVAVRAKDKDGPVRVKRTERERGSRG